MPIVLVSTHTIDLVPTSRGIVPIPGGPARYIGEALQRLGYPHRLITGEKAEVRVIMTQGNEEYVIDALPPIAIPARIEGEALILSPIINEVDPRMVPNVEGLLAIDLQGFVRTPGRPSNERGKSVNLGDLLRRASVVKGSPEEFSRLDEATRGLLPGRILAITHGAEGVTVVDQGIEHLVESERIEVEHTIGAGDSFLARFVVGLLRGESSRVAAEKSVMFTVDLLRERALSAGVGYTTATRTE